MSACDFNISTNHPNVKRHTAIEIVRNPGVVNIESGESLFW
jgi:hypothetical protein